MKQILVIQTASIGDVILATAVLEKLHKFHPEAQLDFMIKKGLEGLFEQHPFIHRLWVWDKSRKYRDLLRLLKLIRKERYDSVINIQRFLLTGLVTVFSGAMETVGFSKNPLSLLFTKRIPHPVGPGIHETDRNQKLIASVTDEKPEKPRLYTPPLAPPQEGRGISGIPYPVSRIYYTISPASLWFTKQFPAEKWVELITRISDDAMVYLLGSADDYALCERIREEGRKKREEGRGKNLPESEIRNLAGTLSLLESAALMRGARMNFTNDSAPMHLASAVNAPVTVVYCSTTPDFGFGPLSDDSAVVEIRESLECRPCGLHGWNSCPKSHFRCAYDIDPGRMASRL
ncbi:MAG: glycosyltransferase family 9 protein [bacterium]